MEIKRRKRALFWGIAFDHPKHVAAETPEPGIKR